MNPFCSAENVCPSTQSSQEDGSFSHAASEILTSIFGLRPFALLVLPLKINALKGLHKKV